MNKMKRKVCAVLSFVSIICMAIVPAAAETENDAARQERIQAARQYAYLDLESASSEMKEKILSAREIIIYSSDGWCADGFSGTVTYADGTVERVPNFSELFPSDWDLPDDDCLDVTEYVNPEPVIEQDEFELLTAQSSPDINNVIQDQVQIAR